MQNKAIVNLKPSLLAGNKDTALLKLIALLFMMIDHLGLVFFPGIFEMRILGRIAMPLYAWGLIVGCEYTHNIYRYGLRLLVLAVISQPVNMMALGNSWSKLNILFTLFLGVVSIGAIQKKKYYSQFWVPLLCYVVLGFVNVDYGWRGLTFFLLLYAARHSKSALAAVFIAYAMFWGATSGSVNSFLGMPLVFLSWPGVGTVLQPLFRTQAMMWMALPFILISTHSNIKIPKWLGYGFYPLHLLVIIALRLLNGESLTALLSVFQ